MLYLRTWISDCFTCLLFIPWTSAVACFPNNTVLLNPFLASGVREANNSHQYQFASAAVHLLHTLNWTSLNIYTDTVSGGKTGHFLDLLSGSTDVRIMVTSSLDRLHFKELAEKGFFTYYSPYIDHLNVAVCPVGCTRKIFELVSNCASPTYIRLSKWLVISDYAGPDVIYQGMDNIAQVFPKVQNSRGFELLTMEISGDVRKLTPVSADNVYKMASSMGVEEARRLLYPNNNNELNGRTLRVGVGMWSFYAFYANNTSNHSEERYQGHSIDLLNELQKALNFRTEYIELPDNKGMWVSLYKMLQAKEMDMLIIPTMVSTERRALMDFTFPITFNHICVFYKQPPQSAARWRLLVDVLTWLTLVLIGSSLLLTTFVMAAADVVHRHIVSTRCGAAFKSYLIQRLLWLFGDLLKQAHGGKYSREHIWSKRLMLAAWCVFCLVLTVTFTAHLVPLLGVFKQKLLFNTLRDLIDSADYRWGTFGEANWILNYLQETTYTDHSQLYRKMMKFYHEDPDILSSNQEVHLQKMFSEKYAYIVAKDVMLPVYSRRCDLAVVSEEMVRVPAAINMPKNSSYTDMFSRTIVEFYENGVIPRLEKKWIPPRKMCFVEKTSQISLDMVYLQSVFILLAIGLVISTATLFYESMDFHNSKTKIL